MKDMKNKMLLLSLFMSIVFLGINSAAQAQQTKEAASFHGAKAVKSEYRAVFELNSGDDKDIRGTLRNMSNILRDPRLKGKIQLELVAHSGGIVTFMKKNDYSSLLKKLVEQGVILSACENTMRERDIDKSEILPFVSFVPSGVGELVIRQQQGWAMVHP